MSELPNCPYLSTDGWCALTGDFEDCPEKYSECDFFQAYRKWKKSADK